LSHPGTLKKAPLSAETLDLNILSELNTVPSSFKSVSIEIYLLGQRRKFKECLCKLTYLLTLPSASEAIGNNQQQAKFVCTKMKRQ